MSDDSGISDPFRGDLPDFDDRMLNVAADVFAQAKETANAMVGMETLDDIMRATSTLDDLQARTTAVVLAAWVRQLRGEKLQA